MRIRKGALKDMLRKRSPEKGLPPRAPRPAPGPPRQRPAGSGGDAVWLYGRHAVLAAVANPERRLLRAAALAEHRPALAAALLAAGRSVAIDTLDRAGFARLLAADAVHQGFAVLAAPLPESALADVLAAAVADALVLVLDQVSDPRNAGAILRAAAAFAACAVIVQDRHAPPASGALAKAASGALETVPLVRVVNLARTLDALRDEGFRCLGLAGDGDVPLAMALAPGQAAPQRMALVLGAEDAGLRRLVRAGCDELVRIPISPAIESLNVATAAAIALYEIRRGRSGGGP
jgi:23S rRNA (guanosine2251-2'-O)-methyltransferase